MKLIYSSEYFDSGVDNNNDEDNNNTYWFPYFSHFLRHLYLIINYSLH